MTFTFFCQLLMPFLISKCTTPPQKRKKKAFPIIHVDIVPFPGLPYQLTCSALNDRYFNNNNFNPLNRPHISTSSSNIYNCVSLSTKLWSLQRQSYYFLFLSISPGHLTNAVNREPCTIKSDEEMNEWVSWGKCHSVLLRSKVDDLKVPLTLFKWYWTDIIFMLYTCYTHHLMFTHYIPTICLDVMIDERPQKWPWCLCP